MKQILSDIQIDPARLSLEWVSAAEGPRYVTLIKSFTHCLRDLGPLGSNENLDPTRLMIRLRAAKLALEGRQLRMAIARKSAQSKTGDVYQELPPEHKINKTLESTWSKEKAMYEVLVCFEAGRQSVEELAEYLDLDTEEVRACIKRLEKRRLIKNNSIQAD